MGFWDRASDIVFGEESKRAPIWGPDQMGRPSYGKGDVRSDQTFGQQQDLARALQAAMMGQGPSVAELQMQRGLGSAISGSKAIAGSQRGMSPGLAARLQQQSAAGMGMDAISRGGQLRAQEMLAARGQLGGVLGQMQGVDQAAMARAMQEWSTRNNMMTQQYMGQGTPGTQGLAGNILSAGAQFLPFLGSSGGGGYDSGARTAYEQGQDIAPQWNERSHGPY